MAYGMKIYDTDGTTVYYDSSSQGGVFVEVLWLPSDGSTTIKTITYDGTVPSGQSLAKSNLKDMNLKVISLQSGDVAYEVISPEYSTHYGYPQINYKQSSTGFSEYRGDTYLMVLAQ